MSHSQRHTTLSGLVLAIIAAAGFACSIVLARISYDYGTDAQTVLVMRFALLGLLMLGWNLWKGQSLRVTSVLMLGCVLVGLAYFIGIGSYLTAVSYLPVSLAVLIFYTSPIVVTLMAAALERRMPNPLQLLALLVAFVGLTLALDVQANDLNTVGLLFAVVSSIGVSLNMLGSGRILKKLPTTVFSFYMSLSVLVLALLMTLPKGGPALPINQTGWLIFSGMLLAFIIGFMAVYNGVRLIGPVRMSTVMNLEPVGTVLMAVWLLGESLNGTQIIGGLIVLLGILLAQWPNIRPLLYPSAAAIQEG